MFALKSNTKKWMLLVPTYLKTLIKLGNLNFAWVKNVIDRSALMLEVDFIIHIYVANRLGYRLHGFTYNSNILTS